MSALPRPNPGLRRESCGICGSGETRVHPVNYRPADVTLVGFAAVRANHRVFVVGGGELEINSLRLFF
jgi:hypothetical protein